MANLRWLIVASFFLNACTSSRITSSWKADAAESRHYQKIMVIGLIRDADRTLRENMEAHLVSDLQTRGYEAISAFREYGPKAFEGVSEQAALDKIKGSGVDAVLTIVLLDKEKERRYVPGHANYSPYGYYYNHFWRYYDVMNRRIYEPGYYVIDTRYFWESNLYDMKDQQLVYSVQTQSFDPAGTDKLAHEYGQLIVQNMVKKAVLSAPAARPF